MPARRHGDDVAAPDVLAELFGVRVERVGTKNAVSLAVAEDTLAARARSARKERARERGTAERLRQAARLVVHHTLDGKQRRAGLDELGPGSLVDAAGERKGGVRALERHQTASMRRVPVPGT